MENLEADGRYMEEEKAQGGETYPSGLRHSSGVPAGQLIGYAYGGVNPARLKALQLAVTAYPRDRISILQAAPEFLAFLEGKDAA